MSLLGRLGPGPGSAKDQKRKASSGAKQKDRNRNGQDIFREKVRSVSDPPLIITH